MTDAALLAALSEAFLMVILARYIGWTIAWGEHQAMIGHLVYFRDE